MAKRPKTKFVCQSCGHQSPKWVGRCTSCDAWGTVEEERELVAPPVGAAAFGALKASKPRPLHELTGEEMARRSTGFGELDRVLGGGLVAGSLVLVGGDPGIGKSTLLLQACDRLAESGPVLYVTGEESPRQTKMRYERIGGKSKALWLVAETSIERVEEHVRTVKPSVLVVDSIQTLYTEAVSSTPGSVTQLRAVTAKLMGLAKGQEVATFLVGHVTKEGAIAGPRVLEHMVDTVLYFEGQRGHPFRMLRAVKNRFGSTDEIGAFEMRANGLEEVHNPSALFLAERATGTSGSVVAASFEGTRTLLVEVQALVSPSPYGTPRRTATGADAARVALLLAVLEKRAGLDISNSDVFVNIAGGMRLDEPAADLPLCAALASSHADKAIDAGTVLFGEVGLGGEVRAVIGADARVAEAERLGFKKVVLPASNAERIKGATVQVVGVRTVGEALDALA